MGNKNRKATVCLLLLIMFKEMFSNYTFIDGTPCGVVV